jgi:PhnB protein
MKIVPYLNFDGQCADAFRFYERVLGGKLELITHGNSPIAGEVPPEWGDRVMHACLTVGDQALMASDSTPEQHAEPQGIYVSLHVESAEDAERIFGELAEQGRVTMPLGPTFWAVRFGMCVDRFGTPWMVNCSVPAEQLAANLAAR